MSILFRLTDSKSRLLAGIANFSLAAGLILWVFVHPANQTTDSVRHFFAGLLLGLSVTINLFRLYCRRAASAKS